MKGKETKVYTIKVDRLELNTNPKPKYIVSIMQMIPIRTYSLILKTNPPHQTDDNDSYDE